jgi:hypothetical protein
LSVLLLSTAVLFAGLWVVTSKLRRGFLETEYGVWQAKLDMIDACDLGDVVILGDSRASAGLIPQQLHPGASNFALSGTGPIEADFELRRMLRCPKLPKIAVLSFSPHQFEHIDWFWRRSARFGLFSYADLEEIRDAEQSISPGLIYQSAYGSEPPGAVKNWLHVSHFPPYEFADLIGSAVVGRLNDNRRAYQDTLKARGQHLVGNYQQCAEAPDGEIDTRFSPTPLIDRYYERLIGDLHSNGIDIIIMQTPMSELSASKMTAEFESQFAAYLSDRGAGRYVTPATDALFPVRANCDFGDEVHLNQRGADAFSTMMKRQLELGGRIRNAG